jgi:hypothetical protein
LRTQESMTQNNIIGGLIDLPSAILREFIQHIEDCQSILSTPYPNPPALPPSAGDRDLDLNVEWNAIEARLRDGSSSPRRPVGLHKPSGGGLRRPSRVGFGEAAMDATEGAGGGAAGEAAVFQRSTPHGNPPTKRAAAIPANAAQDAMVGNGENRRTGSKTRRRRNRSRKH